MEQGSRTKRIFKKKWLWISIIIVVVIAGGVFATGQKPVIPEYSSTLVNRQTLVQSVSETGSLVSTLEVPYGWETSGKIVEIKKKVGDPVKKGEVMARLDGKQAGARVSEAVASLRSAEARLNLELAGPNEQDRTKSEASVVQANTALDQAKASLEKAKTLATSQVETSSKAVDTAYANLKYATDTGTSALVEDAYEDLAYAISDAAIGLSSALTESDNILGIDNVFANDDFEDVLSAINTSNLNIAKNSYYGAKQATKLVKSFVGSLVPVTNFTALDSMAMQTLQALNTMQLHLLDVAAALDSTLPIGNLSQSELDTLRSNITTARTTVTTDATAVANAKQAITTAQNSLSTYKIAYDKAVQDLANTKKQTEADIKIAEAQVIAQEAALAQAEAAHQSFIAPPRTVDVASLRADVSRAAANVAAMQAEYHKTQLIALTDGEIAKMDIKVGENATIGQVAITVVSGDFSVEVDISESDIAKVQIEDRVSVTFDALPDDWVYTGRVVSIEHAKTEISGVVYYKVKILLGLEESGVVYYEPLKSGMTADVEIFTDERPGVLVIPQRAILEKDGKKIVRVIIDTATVSFDEREVVTGLRGNEGLIEIVSGLNEGEEVITFLK